jgi:hypothetical protein
MSTALTLPYVWATAVKAPVRRVYSSKMNNGLGFYRNRTENLLRRYLHASLAVGRVPSVVSDVRLRGRVSSHRIKNFEDVVIFSIDIERCLKMLDSYLLQLIVKIALQEYLLHDVAEQLQLDVRTVARNYRVALDQLTEILLDRGLLNRSGPDSMSRG